MTTDVKKEPPRAPKDGLRTDFYHGELEETEAKGYRAAGILLIRQRKLDAETGDAPSTCCFEATINNPQNSSSPRIQVLCCAEVRKKKKKRDPSGTLELNFLGGKIEDSDGQDSRVTAAREFWEETGGMVPLSECQRIIGLTNDNDDSTKALPIWCGPGKYALYVACDQDNTNNDNHLQKQWDELPSKYGKAVQSGQELPEGAEATHLVWVDWELIKAASSPHRKKKKDDGDDGAISFLVPNSITTVDDTESQQEPIRTSVQVSNFCKSIFPERGFQAGVDLAIRTLLLEQRTGTGTEPAGQSTGDNNGVSQGEESADSPNGEPNKDHVEGLAGGLENLEI